MRTFAIRTPQMINPMWLNRVLRRGRQPATVAADRSVTLEGETLHFRDYAPEAGTAVEIWADGRGFLFCATVAEIEHAEADRRAALAAAEVKRQARANAVRAEAAAFNARIRLPVAWSVRIKLVLSGLAEESWGDGRNRRTVQHIHLLAPLQHGRLARNKGDLLCTPARAQNGKMPAWDDERHEDGAGAAYQPKVTCKQCLRLARPFVVPD